MNILGREKGSGLKGTPSPLSRVSKEGLGENLWNFQGREISMSRQKVVIDSKFSDASFMEFWRSQGPKMTKRFPPRKNRDFIFVELKIFL